ncbi:MAG: ABC transporter permease [Muribaculaceae bacterium]|nr:ABC transporter permease [Roseburia sp.]MCM1430316.1 ABC transporter permease [Muribaculaceae bacterium]MCM1492488.1 ABC transporter permease [Muribaculaceae bacterium]
MSEIWYMTKRNCLVYLRDKSAVFFSFLTMLIVLGLMVIFLGSMNSENILTVLDTYGWEGRDTSQDARNAAYLIQLWTLAGILMVNSVTVTLTVMGAMVQDETRKRVMAFYVTPVKRYKLTLGYVFSAWLIGIGMCILTLAAGEIWFAAQGFALLPIQSLCKLCGMIVLNCFTFSAIGHVLALFIHSDSAWGGLLTIIGTLVGFAGGIYLPMNSLAEPVQKILKLLPFLHGASMMRVVFTREAVLTTFSGFPEEFTDVFDVEMGSVIVLGEHTFSIHEQVLFLLFYAIIAIVAATIVNQNRKLKDR